MPRFFSTAALIFAAVFASLPAAAASERVLAAARACEAVVTSADSIAERGERHRQKVECLKALYIQIAAPGDDSAEAEIRRRLDALEAAYYQSRDLCAVQNQARRRKNEAAQSCGTIGLAPREFRILLKTMIVNEDAGWVKIDPRLEAALRLGKK
jgi:HEPN domain-containing protein